MIKKRGAMLSKPGLANHLKRLVVTFIEDNTVKYGEIREINFDDWCTELKELMNKNSSNEGLPIEPDSWCEKDRWLQHYKQKLTPEQAYIFEL